MQKAKLENWYVSSSNVSPYASPEQRTMVVCGEVYGHLRFTDGHRITTSSVKEIHKDGLVETQNTLYKLGKPDPKYVEVCKENGWHVPTSEEPIKAHDE